MVGGTKNRAVRYADSEHWWTCVCGKIAYRSRKAARKVTYDGMRPYECDKVETVAWHLGHMPRAIKKGKRTAREIYRR